MIHIVMRFGGMFGFSLIFYFLFFFKKCYGVK